MVALGVGHSTAQSAPLLVSMGSAGPEKRECEPCILQANQRGHPNRSGAFRSGAMLSYFKKMVR